MSNLSHSFNSKHHNMYFFYFFYGYSVIFPSFLMSQAVGMPSIERRISLDLIETL